MQTIIETKGSTIVQFLRGLQGGLYVTFEEVTYTAWLYDLLTRGLLKDLDRVGGPTVREGRVACMPLSIISWRSKPTSRA
jgi:hypothetical protein